MDQTFCGDQMIDDTELLEMFRRYAETEGIATERIRNADFAEQESVDRLNELRRRWRRMGVAPRPS